VLAAPVTSSAGLVSVHGCSITVQNGQNAQFDSKQQQADQRLPGYNCNWAQEIWPYGVGGVLVTPAGTQSLLTCHSIPLAYELAH